jgi:KaiC/GvpD/RAD55 family RecA-like ATPase
MVRQNMTRKQQVNRGRPITGSAQMILRQLEKTKHGEHNILVYPNTSTLNSVMAAHYKEALEERNELALFVTMYTHPDKVRTILGKAGLDVGKYEEEGSLVIYDAVKGYQSTEGVYTVMALINMLFERASKLRKTGMFGMADMGSFFVYEAIDKLISYELSLPSIWKKMKLRSFCLYHREDFNSLLPEERQALIDHHYKYIKAF